MARPLWFSLVFLAACGGGANATLPASPSPSPSASPTVAPVTLQPPKPKLKGLIDMQNISWHNVPSPSPPPFDISDLSGPFAGMFGGTVINARWKDIQPAQTGTLDFSSIDGPLALVQTYNDAHPSAKLGVKLRIYGTTDAPDWAKNIGGTPIPIYRNPAGCNGQVEPPDNSCLLSIGRYWTTAYISAWRAFQSAVAQRYDTNALIDAVAVTSCASQTDEPFVPTSGPQSRANLQNAGLTDAAQQACLMGAIDDYANYWKNTPIDYTFNEYVDVGGGGTDLSFTQSVMAACRSQLGGYCVIDNHALSGVPVPAPTPAGDSVYTMIQQSGPPIDFQTQAPGGFSCWWTQTISYGLYLGASAIEVWPQSKYDGYDSFESSPSDVQALSALFSSKPAAAPTPPPNPLPCPGFN